MDYLADHRVILTLDAGGTSFTFSAVQHGKEVTEPFVLPSEALNLDASLANLIAGFEELIGRLLERPAAISFAFPGPADYPRGIVYNVGNLPAYRDGVAIGPMLQEHFDLPVFINNDGDLFAYGEAIAGLLPAVNGMLADAGSTKRYRNLFAATLGTGFGGGIVSNGRLLRGDNSAAGEVWMLRNKARSDCFAEEGASIRAVRGAYAEAAGTDPASAPSPEEIFEIGMGRGEGDRDAARMAFATLGEVVGDALANTLTLVDGLSVIGGGLAGAAPLFMPHLVQEMNSTLRKYSGEEVPRLAQSVYDLTDEQQLSRFLADQSQEIAVPYSNSTIVCDPRMRLGVGVSQLGTNRAVAIGASAYALQQLDQQSAG